MDKNIFADFLANMKNFVDSALEKCNSEEESVASDEIQVTAEEVSQDSIATTKGNEEKTVETTEEVKSEEEVPVLEAADETEGNPDELKNVEVPEEKTDEERLFEVAEQLYAIAKKIQERGKPMTEKQSSFVAKALAKQSLKIAKCCTKKKK